MIIVRISGGLGNQMFQYALARSIKERTRCEVKLDTGYFSNMGKNETPRNFELDVFAITLSVADDNDKKSIGMADAYSKSFFAVLKRKISTFIDTRKPLHKKRLILEPSFTFHDEMTHDIRDGSYISGIWQSEKYFSDIRNILQKEFTLKADFSPAARVFIDNMKNTSSVAFHVRRGDYLTNKKTQTLSLDYYKRATDYLERRVQNIHYFVVSDDIEWVKTNIPFSKPVTYVSSPALKSYEEILLMSFCKHNIIANSSFSWWGAWLNLNPQKIIIAPEKWFSTTINTGDLIPDSWVKV